jgi:peptidoglycan hydrolase-like protein with peptidoglycan-binding domain
MSDILKTGSKGDAVKALQEKLVKLGFTLDADGAYGPRTKDAVEQLQMIFGYDTDGMAGPATLKLVEQQAGLGWSLSAPDAVKRGLQAQGKKTEKGDLAGPELTRTLKSGSEGLDVKYLQRRLVALGLPLEIDGQFGSATEAAVRKLQTAFGYTVDGIAGQGTNKLINQQLGYGWNAASSGNS